MTELQTKTKGRKRVIIAAGALLGIAALATSAAFTDFANLNMGANGIGYFDGNEGVDPRPAFDIQVVKTDAEGKQIAGEWQDAAETGGVPLFIANANALAPGGSIDVSIPYRNNSALFDAAIDLDFKDIPGKTTDEIFEKNLLFTVGYQIGEGDIVNILTDTPYDEIVKKKVGRLVVDDEAKLIVKITLNSADAEGKSDADYQKALQKATAFPQAKFTAESVVPVTTP